MNLLGTSLLALLGLIVGSTIWLVSRARVDGHPLPRGRGVSGASTWKLAVREWVPIVGSLTRCPGAGDGTDRRSQRVLFEIGVAGYYGLAAMRLGDDPDRLIATIVFTVPLLIVLLVDAWTSLIYTDVIAAGLVIGLVVAALDGFGAFRSAVTAAVAAAAVGGALFVLASVIWKSEGIVPFGAGDVWLAAMIGAIVRGSGVVEALFVGALLASLAGLVLLATHRLGRRDPFAYGPYLCVGALLTLLG